MQPSATGKNLRADTDIETSTGRAGHRGAGRVRVATPGVATLVLYWLLSYLNSPDGFLGTDTGGKVATLKAMAENGTYTNVDVGYWAARWDPQGLLHPLYHSLHIGDHWVQVTTLPMLFLGEPLYRIGGYRLTLLLPMIGGIACAYAARALARRFNADTTRQWWAFWIIALASPVVIYSLDFWEHTIGLALMAWGTIALLDLLDADTTKTRAWLCLGAGLAFGFAATMRTEALIYLAISALVVGITILTRDRNVRGWFIPTGALMGGVFIPLAGNWWLSRVILGDGLREGRTAGAAEGLGSSIPLRLREGLLTTFGLASDASTGAILTGVLGAALIAYAVFRGRRGPKPAPAFVVLVPLACVCLLYVVRFASGLDFVSGLVGAAPLAVVGAVAVWQRPGASTARSAVVIALVALPVVWAFQWTGGAGPQWGGRYLLCSMLILVVAGVAALPRLRPEVGRILVTLSLAVTVFGVFWVSVRTHDVARTFATLNAAEEPVLVADIGLQFVPREGGAFYGEHRWLTATDGSDRISASRVVQDAGFDEFGLVSVAPRPVPENIGDFEAIRSRDIQWFQDVTLTVTTYRSTSHRVP